MALASKSGQRMGQLVVEEFAHLLQERELQVRGAASGASAGRIRQERPALGGLGLGFGSGRW